MSEKKEDVKKAPETEEQQYSLNDDRRVKVLSPGALVAQRLCPACRQAMLASHVSREPAGAMMLQALGLTPIIHAGMALGEGTGAVALMPLIDMALAVYHQGSSFEGIQVAAYQPQQP